MYILLIKRLQNVANVGTPDRSRLSVLGYSHFQPIRVFQVLLTRKLKDACEYQPLAGH